MLSIISTLQLFYYDINLLCNSDQMVMQGDKDLFFPKNVLKCSTHEKYLQ